MNIQFKTPPKPLPPKKSSPNGNSGSTKGQGGTANPRPH